IMSRPDCSLIIAWPIKPRVTSHASVAPPALDSVLGVRTTSVRPTAGPVVNTAANTVSEATRIQTRNDEALMLKFAAPKRKRRCAPEHGFMHVGPGSGADTPGTHTAW